MDLPSARPQRGRPPSARGSVPRASALLAPKSPAGEGSLFDQNPGSRTGDKNRLVASARGGVSTCMGVGCGAFLPALAMSFADADGCAQIDAVPAGGALGGALTPSADAGSIFNALDEARVAGACRLSTDPRAKPKPTNTQATATSTTRRSHGRAFVPGMEALGSSIGAALLTRGATAPGKEKVPNRRVRASGSCTASPRSPDRPDLSGRLRREGGNSSPGISLRG